jgi:serine/threonine protein kinase
MASVFRASRITSLGGHVAVKVLAPCFARTVVARRFEREAQIVSRLTSPYIVRIYEYDKFQLPESANHLFYIAMELVEGQTLDALLKTQGKVNFIWAIDVLRQVCRGLDEAHGQGIVHRDLKPTNIMLIQQRGSTHVKILDFGIAALTDRETTSEKLTQTGFVSGTPDYMSPEQAVGDPTTPAADIYALGLIAFEMLTGRRPFEGNAMTSLMARVSNPAQPLREAVSDAAFPPDLCRIVDKMLAREVKDRYPDAGALLDALGRFPTLQTTPDFIPPADLIDRYATVSKRLPPEVAPPTSKNADRPRSPRWGLFVLIFGLLAAFALGLALLLGERSPEITEHEIAQIPDVTSTDKIPNFQSDIGNSARTDTSTGTSLLSGPRPPLEPGFVETVIPKGVIALGLALPTERFLLSSPLPLRVSWTVSDQPLIISSGRLELRLDGTFIGRNEGLGRASDGRLLIDLPSRPIATTYDLELTLALPDGTTTTTRLRYDASAQTLGPRD